MALTKIKLDQMVTGTLPDANIPDTITIDVASAVPASGLTGNTLASGVTASSLTSVGTLTGLTLSGAIVGSNGSASAPSHSFSANTDSGMYSPADNQLGLASGGTLALIFGGDQSATFYGTIGSGAITSTGKIKTATTFHMADGSNYNWELKNSGSTLLFYENQVVGHNAMTLSSSGALRTTAGMTVDGNLVVSGTGSHTFAGDLSIPQSKKLYLDGGGDTYLWSNGANQIDVKVADTKILQLTAGTFSHEAGTAVFAEQVKSKSFLEWEHGVVQTEQRNIKYQAWYSAYASSNIKVSNTYAGNNHWYGMLAWEGTGYLTYKITGVAIKSIYFATSNHNWADSTSRDFNVHHSFDNGTTWVEDVDSTWTSGSLYSSGTIDTDLDGHYGSTGCSNVMVKFTFDGSGHDYVSLDRIHFLIEADSCALQTRT